LSEDLKAVALRWFEEWWNLRRDDVIEQVTTLDTVAIVEGIDGGLNRDGLREHRRVWLNAVPDMRVEILLAVSEGTAVVVHWRATGTHLGPGLGIPPSGRPVDFSGFTEMEFRNGLIARGVDHWNRGEMIASLMQVRMQELREHAGLTAREAQVALLMAERLTHTEIASELKIKPNTARRHCENVLSKLGVKRRQQVAQALGKIPGSVLNRHGSDLEEQSTAAV
jgi:DNA-binding CsgD family transcriptional regulator/predicted ester cyclase